MTVFLVCLTSVARGAQESNHERRVDVLYMVDSVLQAIAHPSAAPPADGPPPKSALKDSIAAALSRQNALFVLLSELTDDNSIVYGHQASGTRSFLVRATPLSWHGACSCLVRMRSSQSKFVSNFDCTARALASSLRRWVHSRLARHVRQQRCVNMFRRPRGGLSARSLVNAATAASANRLKVQKLLTLWKTRSLLPDKVIQPWSPLIRCRSYSQASPVHYRSKL